MFKHALLGGTFDHLHKGHKHFIDTALSDSSHLTIGITTGDMYREKPFAEQIESYEVRRDAVQSYLAEKQRIDSTIIPIHDMYANTLEESGLDALFVIASGLPNAQLINEKRLEKGFPKMHVITVDEIPAADGTPLSSRRIRKGEIDRSGNVFLDLFQKTLRMPEKLRSALKQPFGEVVKNVHAFSSKGDFSVTVGDIVTYAFRSEHIYPEISIIDFRTNRESLTDAKLLAVLPRSEHRVANAAGTITPEAVQSYHAALGEYFDKGEKSIIAIDGEEDLLALPAILLSPLNGVVFYGISGVGMIAVRTSEEKKQEMRRLLAEFTS